MFQRSHNILLSLAKTSYVK